jgi:(p)ppGpp synthase/HD superfamily hydrolase
VTGHAWQRAASFAARAHAGQTRKDGKTPYAAHCFRVALVVRHVFGCDDEMCLSVALLHDVIEDTPADFDDVAEAFGVEVARDVAALTKDMRLPEGDREPAYDVQLRQASWRARLVKLADVYDNLCDAMDEGSPLRIEKAVSKCERAMGLARQEPGGGACAAAALAAVSGLIERAGAGSRR